MTKTTIYYYISSNGRNPVREFILNLQKQQQAKVRRFYKQSQNMDF